MAQKKKKEEKAYIENNKIRQKGTSCEKIQTVKIPAQKI